MKQREQALLLLTKADQDLALIDEVISAETVSDEILGFHAQQAAEKLLKAALSEMGVRFRKTHDIGALCDLLRDGGAEVPPDIESLDQLTPFGAIYRYEDYDSAVGFDRTNVRRQLAELRTWVLKRIG